jgi:hypothetical protein
MMIESIGWYTNDGDPHPYFWDGWSGWGLGTDQKLLQGAGDLNSGRPVVGISRRGRRLGLKERMRLLWILHARWAFPDERKRCRRV